MSKQLTYSDFKIEVTGGFAKNHYFDGLIYIDPETGNVFSDDRWDLQFPSISSMCSYADENADKEVFYMYDYEYVTVFDVTVFAKINGERVPLFFSDSTWNEGYVDWAHIGDIFEKAGYKTTPEVDEFSKSIPKSFSDKVANTKNWVDLVTVLSEKFDTIGNPLKMFANLRSAIDINYSPPIIKKDLNDLGDTRVHKQ